MQTPFAAGQYYHAWNRGAGRHPIFVIEENYRYLTRLMAQHSVRYCIAIIAYCLMPNHYHLLLRQETDRPVSKFINTLFSAYVQALNRQQGRTGTLFEGRFQHRCIAEWADVLQLCRYLHLNPVKAGLVSRPEDWRYSDYGEWAGLREGGFGDRVLMRSAFPDPEEYRAFVESELVRMRLAGSSV